MVGLDFSDPLTYTGIGNTVFDLSVNTYRGTLTNGPKFTNDKNGGIIFDGVDDRIDFSSNLSLKFDGPLYISLDIDGLDPAFAPGVSHPEPGGLTTRNIINIINELEGNVVGGDIVEYNPINDINDITAYTAAKLLKEIIGKVMDS